MQILFLSKKKSSIEQHTLRFEGVSIPTHPQKLTRFKTLEIIKTGSATQYNST